MNRTTRHSSSMHVACNYTRSCIGNMQLMLPAENATLFVGSLFLNVLRRGVKGPLHRLRRRVQFCLALSSVGITINWFLFDPLVLPVVSGFLFRSLTLKLERS
eukprot:g31396.t1